MKFLDRLFSKRQGSQYDGDNALLVKAMHELALNNNPENRKRMYEELLKSTILIPTPEPPTDSRSGKESDVDVTLQLVFINDGQGHRRSLTLSGLPRTILASGYSVSTRGGNRLPLPHPA